METVNKLRIKAEEKGCFVHYLIVRLVVEYYKYHYCNDQDFVNIFIRYIREQEKLKNSDDIPTFMMEMYERLNQIEKHNQLVADHNRLASTINHNNRVNENRNYQQNYINNKNESHHVISASYMDAKHSYAAINQIDSPYTYDRAVELLKENKVITAENYEYLYYADPAGIVTLFVCQVSKIVGNRILSLTNYFKNNQDKLPMTITSDDSEKVKVKTK